MVKNVVQPEVNIGLVGHVDHGKTTLTEALSGKWTDTHSEEIKRGITIRLGYADAAVYKTGKTFSPKKSKTLVRRYSLVDAPGHESLMATMLAGTTIMDGALLLIAANEQCPQPQTREHLMALQICGLKNVVVVQNKIDLVSEENAMKNYHEIKDFLKGTDYEDAPIIPISAKEQINIDVLLEAMQEKIPTPERDEKKDPRLYIARSFDINKPGSDPLTINGGVLGGSVTQGIFKVGEEVEIRPGRIVEEANKKVAKPLKTKIVSLQAGGSEVKELKPGGSSAMLTMLDPSIVKSDALTGNIVGEVGKLPDIWYELPLECTLLDRVVGSQEDAKVNPLIMNETLMLNVNSATTIGIITKLKKNKIICRLKLPVCAENESRVTISRIIGRRFRLIGFGIIKDWK